MKIFIGVTQGSEKKRKVKKIEKNEKTYIMQAKPIVCFTRINEVHKINQKLTKLGNWDNWKSI